MNQFRFSDFDSYEAAGMLANRSVNAHALSPRTLIIGIPSNVETWPANRSYLSIMRIAGSDKRILQLSHYTEVTVIEVTDRHKIPATLGWSEPGIVHGLNIPSWHKELEESYCKTSLANAIDDVLVTYYHHTPMSEHFYFLGSELALGPVDRGYLKRQPENLHMLSRSAESRLPNARGLFTDPDRREWLGISPEDWDDEIGYAPRFGVLTNHRGAPIALFDFEARDFELPKKLRLWDGSRFTTKSELARLVCKEATTRRKNFEIVSAKLVEKIWPGALKESYR